MGFNRGLGGFNRSKFNSDTFSNVLYSTQSASTTTEGTITACIDFYVECASDSLTAGSAISKLLQSLTMEYSGALSVGKKVCINANNFTVTLDGANTIDKFDGLFPEVFPVNCSVVYEDSEVSRTVKVIVSRRDRKI
jgi:hypothetical protein